MLSKRCVFGGGLLLGSTVVITSSISNAAVQLDAVTRNTLFQADWRSIAYSEISHEEYLIDNNRGKEKEWIIDKEYKESIIEVIGKALGDCLTNMNEFDPKNIEQDGIITFKDTDPSGYSKENWNAVLLYNYVYFEVNELKMEKQKKQEREKEREKNDTIILRLFDMNARKKREESEKLERQAYAKKINNWLEKIKDHYALHYQNVDTAMIDSAWKDIQVYNKALSITCRLSDYLDRLMNGQELVVYGELGFRAQSNINDYQGSKKFLYNPIYSFDGKQKKLCISGIIRDVRRLRCGNTDEWVTDSDCWPYVIYGENFNCKPAQNIMMLFKGLDIEITYPTPELIEEYEAKNIFYAYNKGGWDYWDGGPEKRYSDEFYNRQFVPLYNE